MRGSLTPLTAGCQVVLRKISDAVPLLLVSMADKETVTCVLKTAGVLDCFTALITAEDCDRPKPDPDPYQRALKLLNARRGARWSIMSMCIVMTSHHMLSRVHVCVLAIYSASSALAPLEPRHCCVLEDTAAGVTSGTASVRRALLQPVTHHAVDGVGC